MNAKDVLKNQIETAQMITRGYIEDLQDEELLVRTVPNANHIAWQLGHMLASEHDMLAALGHQPPALPEGFAAAHTPETATSDDASRFFPQREYLRLLDEMKDASLAAVDSTPRRRPGSARTGNHAVLRADDRSRPGNARPASSHARRPVRPNPPQARQATAVLKPGCSLPGVALPASWPRHTRSICMENSNGDEMDEIDPGRPQQPSEADVQARPTAQLCANCGTALLNTDPESRCPTCGLPVTVQRDVDAPAALLDSAGVVCADLSCRKCAYNLRGLHRDGRCPECGAAVALSTQRDLLCFAEPNYVRRLARGNTWLARGLTAVIVSVALVMLAMIPLAIGAAWFPDTELIFIATSISFGTAMILLPIGLIVALVGVWIITTPQPSVFDPTRQRSARRIRWLLLIGCGGLAIPFLLSTLITLMPLRAIIDFGSLGATAAGIVGVVALISHVQTLAQRIPDTKLSKSARKLRYSISGVLWLLFVCHAIKTIYFWGFMLFPVTPISPAGGSALWQMNTGQVVLTFTGCGSTIGALLLIGAYDRMARLHRQLTKPLQQQARLAKKHWVDVPPSAHPKPAEETA